MNRLDLTVDQLKRLLPEELDEDTREIHGFLIEQGGYWEIDADRTKTLRACWEVLCRLPEKVTQKIIYGEPLVLIAPTRSCWGMARPMAFPKPIEGDVARLGWVYLAPELEEQDDRVIVGVVAHELAHVQIADITGDEAERKADALIREWGFSAELEKLREVNPSHRY